MGIVVAKYQEYLNRTKMLSFKFKEVTAYKQETGALWLSSNGIRLVSHIHFPQQNRNVSTESMRYGGRLFHIIEEGGNYSVFSVNETNTTSHNPHFDNSFSLLLGFIPLGTWNEIVHVGDILRNYPTKTADSGNADFICLETVIKGIKVSCWFDRQHDFVLSRCCVEKKPQMVLDEVISFDCQLKDFILVNGVWLPTLVESKQLITAQKPDDKSDKMVVYSGNSDNCWHLSDFIVMDSVEDHFFDLQFSIPNYTEVHVLDIPQIKYVWVDGKVKPLTDELAEERLRGVKFIPGVADSRFWLMFVGFVLFAFALAKLVWNYFKNKNNKGDDDDNE